MEALVIEILRWAIPIIIALASLSYTILERRKQKKDSLKKGYLESAQSNLNLAIDNLRKISIPQLSTLNEGYDTWGDLHGDVYTNVTELLRYSFELKEKKITVNFPYEINYLEELDSSRSNKYSNKRIRDFSSFSKESFSNFFHTQNFILDAKFEIPNFEQEWKNDISFDFFIWGLRALDSAKENLLAYEEVYENLSLDPINKINNLYEEITSEILKTIQNPKSMEINLDDFSNTTKIMAYIIENVLNHSHIAKKFLKVNELISELTEARKELFLRISS